jgi:hypothetical protein
MERMESADDVRASLAVLPLADLRPHEQTSAPAEAGVRDLLLEAGVLSWPLIVDAGSGLILDGTHRAVVLARDLGARWALVQRVELDAPSVRVGTWCRVLEGVAQPAFDHARRALGLERGGSPGLRCHYAGRVYTRPGAGALEAHGLVQTLERLLSSNGHAVRARLVEEEAVGPWLQSAEVVVLRPPAMDKATVRRRADGALWPPKSTRFVLPYRVVGLDIPLAALGGSRDSLVARLEHERARLFLCLGAGLSVDRRYPERLWQVAGYRAPDRLFADEASRRAYADALARADLAIPPSDPGAPSRQRSQDYQDCQDRQA